MVYGYAAKGVLFLDFVHATGAIKLFQMIDKVAGKSKYKLLSV